MESTDYDNIESTGKVGPDLLTCNAHVTLTMYDATKEFPKLFPEEKPTELPPLRYPLGIMQNRIDVIPDSHWSPRFSSTYNQFKNQITQKIYTQLQTGRVVPSRSSNTIGIFPGPKNDKRPEARFQLDCILRNLVTYEDTTQMSSMRQIMDFVGSRRLTRKLDLTDGYYYIRIYLESVKDSTFCCQMVKFDSLVMQQGDCNAPATLMRAMNCLSRNIQDLMIYVDDILIANHSYEEHIKTIRVVIKIAKDNKLSCNENKCQCMPARM